MSETKTKADPGVVMVDMYDSGEWFKAEFPSDLVFSQQHMLVYDNDDFHKNMLVYEAIDISISGDNGDDMFLIEGHMKYEQVYHRVLCNTAGDMITVVGSMQHLNEPARKRK